MVFAGLWETWKGQGHEDPLQTFTIVTTEPNAFAARWHDRMPVVLPEARWDEWLDPGATREQLQALLVPYEGVDIEAWPVSPRMNTPRFESPECITKVSVPMPRP